MLDCAETFGSPHEIPAALGMRRRALGSDEVELVAVGCDELAPVVGDEPEVGGPTGEGQVASSDILEGLDVIKVTGLRGVPSPNSVTQDYFNAQTQYSLAPGQ